MQSPRRLLCLYFLTICQWLFCNKSIRFTMQQFIKQHFIFRISVRQNFNPGLLGFIKVMLNGNKPNEKTLKNQIKHGYLNITHSCREIKENWLIIRRKQILKLPFSFDYLTPSSGSYKSPCWRTGSTNRLETTFLLLIHKRRKCRSGFVMCGHWRS